MGIRGLLILLLGVCCGVLPARDVLDDLSDAVDQLEGCFWRGFFHASGHARRDRCEAAMEKVQKFSRAVQTKRKDRAQLNRYNPTESAMALASLLRSSHYAGEPISVPAQKSTKWSSFMKEFRSRHPVKKGVDPAEPEREDFEDWLQKISDDNAAKFSQGIRTGKKVTKLQRTRLLGIEQHYRNAIVALRLVIFDLRRNDLAFIRPEKTKKEEAEKTK